MKRTFLLHIVFFLIVSLIQPSLLLGDSKALFEQGMEAFKSGNYGSSELLFRMIIEEDDEYRDRAWYYLALSIYNQKKYKSAIFELNRFLTICTTAELCSLSRYWIAESNYFLKDYISAIEEYKRFISESKDDTYIAFAYDRIGRIYFLQGRYEEAVIEWMKALSRDKDEPRNNRRRLNIGEAHFHNQKYDEAFDLLKTLLAPGIDARVQSKARLLLGRIYQIRGNYRMALHTFRAIPDSLLKEAPFYDVQYYRAMSYLAVNNTTSAREHLESFLLIGSSSDLLYDAKYELGRILIEEKKEVKATGYLVEVIDNTTRPELKYRASMLLGKLYMSREEFSDAVKYLAGATKAESAEEKKEAMILLSKAYMELKKYDDAESILEQLKSEYSFDKDIDYIYFLLGRLYLEKGDMERAIQGFDKIKEINPFSRYLDESYYYLGVAYMRKERKEKAIELFNKYLGIKGAEQRYEAYVHLLDIYVGLKNFKKSGQIAAVIIKYYLNREGVEEVLYWYGRALKKNGLSENRYFSIIIKNFYKSDAAGKVFLLWGDEAFVQNNYRKAERYYRYYLGVEGRRNMVSVFLYRIICLYKLERYTDVISILTGDEIPEVDDYTDKQLTLWLGRCYYQLGDCEKTYNTMYKWRLTDYSLEDLHVISNCAIKVGDIITAQEASELLVNNKKFYAESLYDLGTFFNQKEDIKAALEYFTKLIKECPSSVYEDSAKMEVADIYIKTDRFKEAVASLKEVKDGKLQDKKNAMLIIAYFGMGEDKNAAALSDRYFKQLLGQPGGETVMLKNMQYYYNKKDLKEFKKYAWGLSRFSGNRAYVNYMYGKLYYELGSYKSSYYHFYKILNVENNYINEALYYLGLISIVNDNNSRRALRYFSALTEDRNDKSEYAMKGRLALAVLAYEKGDTTLSSRMLQEILSSGENKILKIQAENLFEYYGFTE